MQLKKSLLCLAATVLVGGALASCGPKPAQDSYEIAVVTDVGQLNDGGFNQGTYEGAKAYAEANSKTYKYYQPANGADATDADRVAAMNMAVENGAKVIVTPGFLQEGAIREVASAHPEVKFLFVDGYPVTKKDSKEVLPNVHGIAYKEHQSAYFAGYGAVMEGYTKLGGTFGGGGTNPACNRFAYGYVQGAIAGAKAKEDTALDIKISFKYGGSFGASTELQGQIGGWYGAGTEVVFSCGGSMVDSVIAAAKANGNKAVIGVDTDQSKLYTNLITSATKGLAKSVQVVLGQYYDGKWDTELAGKSQSLGIESDAIGLPTATTSWRFQNWTVEEYNTLYTAVKADPSGIKDDVPANADVEDFWSELTGDSGNSSWTVALEK